MSHRDKKFIFGLILQTHRLLFDDGYGMDEPLNEGNVDSFKLKKILIINYN